jgi:hypothetical protein
MSKILNVRLPNAPSNEYSAEQFNQLVRSLEQIVFQLNTTYTPIASEYAMGQMGWMTGAAGASGIAGQQGAQQLLVPHATFSSDQDQTAASVATAYEFTCNSTVYSQGIYLADSTKVTVDQAGIYNIQFSVQLANNDNDGQDVSIWFRKNGTDIAASNSDFGLPARKSVGAVSRLIAALNYYVDLNPNDYIEIMWRTSDLDVTVEHFDAVAAGAGTPDIPATPSVIITAHLVSSLS